MSKALQAVLFDMDGLLVDTEHTWFVAEADVMRRLGGVWTAADQAAMVGGPMERMTAYMSERVGGVIAPDAIADLVNQTMLDLLAHGADHRPGAERLLDALVAADVPCALVSASHRPLVDAVLASVGGDHFAVTIAGDEVARTKPHPDPYLLAAERLGVDPRRCVVLEDSPTGIAAAEAAGCVVVAVPFMVPIEPAPTRHVVGSLLELTPASLEAWVAERSDI